jgi:hypothetical protein
MDELLHVVSALVKKQPVRIVLPSLLRHKVVDGLIVIQLPRLS